MYSGASHPVQCRTDCADPRCSQDAARVERYTDRRHGELRPVETDTCKYYDGTKALSTGDFAR